MILDSLTCAERYESIHPLFKKAFDYLRQIDFAKVEIGTVELQGRDLFAMISDTPMKNIKAAKLEVHNKYIDIQVPISRAETFGWTSRSHLQLGCGEFNEEKDIQFFDDITHTQIKVEPLNFIIFYPDDAHAPCIGDGVVRKVVVKIKL